MWNSCDFINDADYVVKPTVNGKRRYCPFYVAWNAMKRRCCADEYKIKNPTYTEVTCCEEWLYFSNFKVWMETQYWKGMDLDKDILIKDNQIYSPITCRFVPHNINSVFRDTKQGAYPIGVHYIDDYTSPNKKKYMCQAVEFGKGQKYKGVYSTPEEAHSVWQLAKVQFLKEAVQWWKTDAAIKFSYQEDLAVSILDRASMVWHDYLNGKETQSI